MNGREFIALIGGAAVTLKPQRSRSVIVAAGSMLTIADRYASLSVHQEKG
jgi:hypothetical protein